MKIKFKKIFEDSQSPTRGSSGAAGYDLYAYVGSFEEGAADYTVELKTHQNHVFHTGIALEIPEGYVGLVFGRSGLGVRQQLSLSNCVGVIDSDYRGEIMVALQNMGFERQLVRKGDRIAQIVVVPFQTLEMEETSDLSDSVRGTGGLGSTGK